MVNYSFFLGFSVFFDFLGFFGSSAEIKAGLLRAFD